MRPMQSQVRPGPGRCRGAGRGRRKSRRYALAALGLAFALFRGLAGVANAAVAAAPPAPADLAAGQCDIQAAQGGNADFEPAAAVIQVFTVTAAGLTTPSATPTATAGGGLAPGRTPAASGSGPGRLVAILLAVAIALLAGVLSLLAARLSGSRRRPRSRPPAPQAALVQAEPDRRHGPLWIKGLTCLDEKTCGRSISAWTLSIQCCYVPVVSVTVYR